MDVIEIEMSELGGVCGSSAAGPPRGVNRKVFLLLTFKTLVRSNLSSGGSPECELVSGTPSPWTPGNPSSIIHHPSSTGPPRRVDPSIDCTSVFPSRSDLCWARETSSDQVMRLRPIQKQYRATSSPDAQSWPTPGHGAEAPGEHRPSRGQSPARTQHCRWPSCRVEFVDPALLKRPCPSAEPHNKPTTLPTAKTRTRRFRSATQFCRDLRVEEPNCSARLARSSVSPTSGSA
jgi:hypothetical protein